MATLFELKRQVDVLQAQLLELRSEVARGNVGKPFSQQWELAQQQIRGVESQIIGIENQVAAGDYTPDPTSAPVSSGATVANAATAKDDGATTTNPSAPNGTVKVVSISNEELAARGTVETGTNGRVRPSSETQSTPPAGPKVYKPPVSENDTTVAAPTTQESPGVGARNDDAIPRTSVGAQSVINAAFSTPENARIISQPNVLNQYASYTYSISWYLLTPNQYNDIINFKEYNCSKWQLLMQSGGAPTQATPEVAGRNQYFDLDYYMDDLEIESSFPLKGTGSAHSAASLRFKVVEPNGITLVNNLYRAVDDLYKASNSTNSTTTTTPNYPMAQYCLAIRFYGYDQNGLPSRVKGQTKTTDPLAAVEKFYPFLISDLRFRMANRSVEYEIKGFPIGHFYAFGQDRGAVPFQFQLVGETVGDILQGKPVGTNYAVPEDGRKTSPQPKTATQAVPPIPHVGIFLSPEQMVANQKWYNQYGTTYNADGTPKG